MIFDTDVLIWVLRGNAKAARALDEADQRSASVVTYMELVQGARNAAEMRTIKSFLADLDVLVLPLTENIGHRASIYLEEYGLKAGLRLADALIAATAVETQITLCTANVRHYQAVRELAVQRFRP